MRRGFPDAGKTHAPRPERPPAFLARQNELVFISQALGEFRSRQELAACPCPEDEIGHWQRGGPFADPWPVP